MINKLATILILIGLGLISISPAFNDIAKADTVQTTLIVHLCGNGIPEGSESCDDGLNNGTYGSSIVTRYCNSDCTGWAPYCGDSTIQALYGEECDDGDNDSGDGCSSVCRTEAPVSPPPSGGGGGVYVLPTVTKVVLQGKAYPLAKITILYDGKVATVINGDSQANFKVEITTLTAGTYNFSLWAEDKEGRRSITFSFTITVVSGMTTTISGIFLPPTIELEKVNVLKGETLKILGQTAPESEINVHIESPQEIVKATVADKEGDWVLPFDTTPLNEGSHTARAKAESIEGLLSSFSKVLGFYIGKYGAAEICPRADFNKDGRTNLIDFSILLYWWGKYNPCADQNQDGTVNLKDFSILMYWWTG